MSARAEPSATGATPPFTLAVVRNTRNGGRMCKVLAYNEASDSVDTRTEAFLCEGTVKQVTFDSIRAFMEFRSALGKDSALMMGKPIYPEASIATQAALVDLQAERRVKERIIARDRDHVSWSDGPALVMLDLDRPDRFPKAIQTIAPTSLDTWREALIKSFPALAAVQMGWAVSSSSHLHVRERELQGLRGQRFYLPIESGLEIPRFKEALRDALVLDGLFWYAVDNSGGLRLRFPFDLSVFRPEHLDFAAGPECIPPLEWRPPRWRVWNDGGPCLTASDLSVTTPENRRRIDALLREARSARLNESSVRREAWKKTTGRAIADRAKLSASQAEAVAEAAVERGVLLPEFVLTDSEGQTVTVGELLNDPHAHHGRRLRDPLEPEYRDDHRIAVFLVDAKGRARIYSHAHGSRWWRCERFIPTIRIGLLSKTVDQVVEALEAEHCGLYRNGNALVVVNHIDSALQHLAEEGLGLRLQRNFNFERLHPKLGWIPADVPPRVLRAVHGEAPTLPIPFLKAVVQGPFALADGTVVDTPGYDPVSQVMYLAQTAAPPGVRRTISVPEAADALRRLWEPVRLFPFLDDVDRGVLLAAMISAVIRPSIDIAPAYYITAHSAGTGKTLLAQCIGALQVGGLVAATPLPRDEEERRKHLFASLRQGLQFLLYDNAERGSVLDSPVLASHITSPVVEGRVLGVSTVERRPNRMSLALTGNNLAMRGDMNRRILPVRLDAEVERPWTRSFPFHPVRFVLAHFVPLRIAALEVIHAWRTLGAPPAPGASAFNEWDDVVRATVGWAARTLDIGVGFADPIEATRAAYETDPEIDVLGNLLKAWYEVFRDREVLLRNVVERAAEAAFGKAMEPASSCDSPEQDTAVSRLQDALDAVLERDRNRYGSAIRELGAYIRRHDAQPACGLKFTKGGTTGGARRWRVVPVNQPTVARGES